MGMAKNPAGKASTVRTEHPKTFGEIVNVIEELRGAQGEDLWFRGCSRADYRLLPSLYRHKKKTTIGELALLEKALMTRFRQRSIPFRTSSLSDEWDCLFYMQHYRVPTRLLDW